MKTRQSFTLFILSNLLFIGQVAFGQNDTVKANAINSKPEVLQYQLIQDEKKVEQLTETVQELKLESVKQSESLHILEMISVVAYKHAERIYHPGE